MSEELKPNPEIEMLRKHAQALGEHFDSVHIFVNRVEGPATRGLNWGIGNWFARFGQIREWVIKEEAVSIREVESDNMEEE